MRPNRSLFMLLLLMLIPVSITLGADAAGREPRNSIRGHDRHDVATPHIEFKPISPEEQHDMDASGLPSRDIDVATVFQFGGISQRIFKHDSFVFIDQEAILTAVDVSNPFAPSPVDHLRMPAVGPSMAMLGTKLYFAGNRAFGAIDVSNPSNLQLVASYETTQNLYDIAAINGYVYIGSYSGLHILDVKTFQTPVELGFVDIPRGAIDISIVGKYAYVTNADGLHIFDISNQLLPVKVGAIEIETQQVNDLMVVGEHAYAVSDEELVIVDVKDPAHPRVKGTYRGSETAHMVAVELIGDLAYVAQTGPYAIRVIDVSEPTAPVHVSTYTPADAPLDMVFDGDFVYVAAWSSGMRVIDVRSPSTPVEVSSYNPVGGALDVFVHGGYTYVGTASGLRILDGLSLDNIEVVGTVDTNSPVVDMVVTSGRVYVANSTDGLLIIDVDDPKQPTIVGHHLTPAYGIAVDGDYAYVAAHSAGLRIFDISNARDPFEIGFYEELDAARGVAISDNIAYVVDGSHPQFGDTIGLHIFDVSDRTSPRRIGYFPTSYSLQTGGPEQVVVSGSRAYLADRDRGLRIIDVSDPRAPTEIGSFLVVDAIDVAIDGAYAHVADIWNRHYIIDVSQPASPSLVGYLWAGSTRRVTVSNGLAYTVGYLNGLRVYETTSEHTVYGRVVAADGTPLPGVLVRTLFAYTATTDTNGEFAITGLAPGTYNVTAEQAGFQFSSAEVTIPPSVEGVLLVGDSDYDYDATFRPDPNGFQFNNGPLHEGCAAQGWGCYPDVLTRNDFTKSDLRWMFGEDTVCFVWDSVNRRCLDYRDKALVWLEAVNSNMNGGHCFGMAASSVELFDDPDAMPLVYSTANVYDLPLPAIRRSIAAFHVKQFADPFKSYRDIQEEVSTPKATLGDLKAVLDTGSPAVLVMTGQSGHAVTAYALENRGDGVWHVKVYDNNGPGRSDPYIEIDEERNVWRYTTYDTNGNVVSERTGDDKTHSLYVVPDAILTGPQQPPEDWVYQGADKSDSEDFEIWLTGPGHVLITDTSGNQTGFRGGELVNEIPGAHARVVFGGVGDAEPIYELPSDDSYTLLLHSEKLMDRESTELTQFGLGYAVSVTDIDILPSTADTVEIHTDGSAISYGASNPIEPNVTLIFDEASSSDSYELRGVDIGEGRTVSIEADREAEQLVFVSTDEAGGSYDFLLNLADTTSTRRFRHLDIAIGGNDTHYLDHSDWDGRGSIRLLVDENSDGSIDQELELENQPEEYLMLLPTIVR